MGGASVTSAQLQERLAQGLPFRAELKRLARSIFRNEPALADQVDDVLQNVWIRAERAAREEGVRVNNLRAWLLTVVRREAQNMLRELRNRRMVELTEGEPAPPAGPSVEGMRAALAKLMQALTSRQAAVLRDVLIERMSVAEIAAQSGMTEKSVRTVLARVKQALKNQGYETDLGEEE